MDSSKIAHLNEDMTLLGFTSILDISTDENCEMFLTTDDGDCEVSEVKHAVEMEITKNETSCVEDASRDNDSNENNVEEIEHEEKHLEELELSNNKCSFLNSPFRKYSSFDLKVDESQGFRASEIKLFSFKRPHMRAFHFAWWSYHVAFLMWFSISPLLSEVQESLSLSKEQIWTSSIAAVAGTIVMRFALGPFCDRYGPRIPMGLVLLVSAIPTGLIGLSQNGTQLTIIRALIGIGGSTFVMCQYWTSRMFTKELVGTANAAVAGWGNLGGGVTQLLMGSFLFPLVKNHFFDGDADKAWRTVCVVPATLGLITAFAVVKFSDDSPVGNYSKLKKQNLMPNVSVAKSFKKGILDYNTWLLFAQYACCFGVEITMNNAASLYFQERFDLSVETAAAVASIFGWMNIFARGLGGFISDKANAKFGMNGRLLWQSICLFLEGSLVLTFAFTPTLASAICVLIFFSIFVQCAEGSTYGIVPYVNPEYTGSLSGIIGAGGNVGAVAFGLCFRQLSSKNAFIIMGALIMSTSVLSIFIKIKVPKKNFKFDISLDGKDKFSDGSSNLADTMISDIEESSNSTERDIGSP